MENSRENSLENKENKYDILRRKITDLKLKEMNKKEAGENYDLHFDEIDPNALTDEDLSIFEKSEDGTLTHEEYKTYQNTFSGETHHFDGTQNNSSLEFSAWLGNLIQTPEWVRKSDPEWKKTIKKADPDAKFED